nr:RNA-dependent RNA polymerase [Sobelivirales sp.]
MGIKIAILDALFERNHPTKTPGSPLNYLISKNDALPQYKAEICELIDKRVVKLVDLGRKILFECNFYLNPEDSVKEAIRLVTENYTDPVLVGFKGEPRAEGKKPRLVSQVSVITNMIQRLSMNDYLLNEQSCPFGEIPTATGLDITTPSSTQNMYELFRDKTPLMSSDVQGFEYAVKRRFRFAYAAHLCWMMNLCDADMVPFKRKEKHCYLIWGIAWTDVYRLVQTQEGYLLVPPPGQQSSGLLKTYSENSFIRGLMSDEVSRITRSVPVAFTISAGDDNLDTNAPNLGHLYRDLGFVVTDYVEQNSRFNFCSTTFTEHGSYQDNIMKYLYAVMANSRTDEASVWNEFRAFALHPEFPRCEIFLKIYFLNKRLLFEKKMM